MTLWPLFIHSLTNDYIWKGRKLKINWRWWAREVLIMACVFWVSFESLSLENMELCNEKHRKAWIKAPGIRALVKQWEELVLIHCFSTHRIVAAPKRSCLTECSGCSPNRVLIKYPVENWMCSRQPPWIKTNIHCQHRIVFTVRKAECRVRWKVNWRNCGLVNEIYSWLWREEREWKQANLAPDKTAWFQAHFLTYLCLLLYTAEI